MPLTVAAAIGHRILQPNKQLQGRPVQPPRRLARLWQLQPPLRADATRASRCRPTYAHIRQLQLHVGDSRTGTPAPQVLTEGPLIVQCVTTAAWPALWR